MFQRMRRFILILGCLVAAVASAGFVGVAAGASSGAPHSCNLSPKPKTIKLVVAPMKIAAGEAVHFRIDNSTGPPVLYGTPYSIQECVAGVWVLAPFDPPGPWTKQLIAQRPSRGKWQVVQVPTTAAAGEYRIRKSIRTDESNRWLYGNFSVGSPGT